jgi:subtilisin family serine protease
MRHFACIVRILLFLGTLNPLSFSQVPNLIYSNRGPSTNATSAGKEPSYVPGQIIIKIKGPIANEWLRDQKQSLVPDSAFRSLTKKYKTLEIAKLFRETPKIISNRMNRANSLSRDLGLANVYRVAIGAEADIMAVVEDFRMLPEVEYAEPNYIYRTQLLPNDPFLASQQSWGQPYQDLWGLHKISAPQAWDFSTGTGVIVAVIDTGCDVTHPDLTGNIWENPGEIPNNGVDDDANGFIDDVDGWSFAYQNNNLQDIYGHGTHVAGIIAATGDNGIGVAGIAWGARLMIVKGLDDAGSGDTATLANAILYAAENGAQVINMSWGGDEYSQTLEDALAVAASLNVVLVSAAGNDGWDDYSFFPANSRHVIAVGASDQNDSKADFSNYGDFLDVMAPGGDSYNTSPGQIYQNILSLRSSTISGPMANPALLIAPNFLRARGTSMASPHVAGLSALILHRFPSATPEEVRQVIRRAADLIPGAIEKDGTGGIYGYGRINALKSVSATSLGSARIYSPVPGYKSSAESARLKITASCPDFSQWDLDYYSSDRDRTTIYSSTSPQANFQLPDWNTESVPDGRYILRLRVKNQNGEFFLDRMNIELDRAVISDPAFNRAFRAGQVITFRGTAGGGGFSHYILQYQNSASSEWLSGGVILANEGKQKIQNDVLGIWDTSNINQPSMFRVRLVIKRNNLPDVIEEIHLIVDPTLHPGWPRSIAPLEQRNGRTTYSLGYVNHLIAADIDKDGQMEIPVGYGDEVKILRNDGTMEPGWPQKINQEDKNLLIQRSPLAVDLNGDGYLEVAASARGRLFVWDYKGNRLTSFPTYCNLVTISDLDGDGSAEFVCGGLGGIIVYNSNGALRFAETSMQDSECISASVGDLDGDGKAEIVETLYKSPDILINLLNSDGMARPNWPVRISSNNHYPRLPPVLADIDADGILEIISTDDHNLIVLHHDGSSVPGWPIAFPAQYYVTGLSTGDVTGDGRPEIYVGLHGDDGRQDASYLLFYDGSPVPGWPIESGLPWYSAGSGSAAIIDLDGDGLRELIYGAGTAYWPQLPARNKETMMPFSFHARRSNGQELPGFPKPASDVDSALNNTPIVADIDGDGLLEIAWLNFGGNIYMWDTSAPANADSSDWIMNNHDPRNTGALAHTVRDSLSVSTGSVATVRTYGGANTMRVGYARGKVVSGSTPYGTAIFSLARNNIVVSETAIPVSPPTKRARVFIDQRRDVAAMPGSTNARFVDVNTGIATVNCGALDAHVTYTLRNSAGTILTIGHGNLSRGAHFAKFVDQLTEVAQDFSIPADFSTAIQFGLLDVESDQPLSIIALRLTINQRDDPIMTSTPIADLTSLSNNKPIYFPQIADGGGYLTTLIFINTSVVVGRGVLNFYTDDGSPLLVRQLGGARDSRFIYDIPPNGVFVFHTDGSSFEANAGFVEVLPDAYSSAPVGSGFFSFTRENVRSTETGVPAAIPTRHARLFVDMSSGHNTGLAFAAAGEHPAAIAIRAFRQDGITPAGADKTITLAAREHRAAFANELVGELPKNFIGMLDISSDSPFVALALRCLVNERGDFLIATYPTADLTRTAPANPLFFPQIAAGGGYSTQFILQSSNNAATIVLDYLSDTGDPLAVGR